MVILSKDYPVQSIARSNCDPRISDGYAGGQYAIGGTRRLALAAVAVVFCEAKQTQTTYGRAQKTLGELLLEPKVCKIISMLLVLYKRYAMYTSSEIRTQMMSLPNPVALQSSRVVHERVLFFPCG